MRRIVLLLLNFSASLARTFCASVIDHCTRGWIPEKVRAAIPEVLADLVPEDPLPVCPLFPRVTTASAAAFAYEATAVRDDGENEEELTALQRAARELKKMIESKASSSAVEEWLDSLNAEELQGELTGFAVQVEQTNVTSIPNHIFVTLYVTLYIARCCC